MQLIDQINAQDYFAIKKEDIQKLNELVSEIPTKYGVPIINLLGNSLLTLNPTEEEKKEVPILA